MCREFSHSKRSHSASTVLTQVDLCDSSNGKRSEGPSVRPGSHVNVRLRRRAREQNSKRCCGRLFVVIALLDGFQALENKEL